MPALGHVRPDGADVRRALLPAAAVGHDPREARAAARDNEHHAAKLRTSAAGLASFPREVGLIGGSSERLWKRAKLV